jgi:hypothetical protein
MIARRPGFGTCDVCQLDSKGGIVQFDASLSKRTCL